jgi:hypothetical protein
MTVQFVVTFSGSLESANTLHRLLAPSGYINCPMTEKMLANALAYQIHHRLLQILPPDEKELQALNRT